MHLPSFSGWQFSSVKLNVCRSDLGQVLSVGVEGVGRLEWELQAGLGSIFGSTAADPEDSRAEAAWWAQDK